MHNASLLAAADLGSNSFRLEVARVEGEQLYPLDAIKETVRLAAGLTDDNRIDEDAQNRALDCLRRFGERLRGFDRHTVRAVATNTFRVAGNAPGFLARAEAALGFPIDIIAGREEARLIYLGVSHGMPMGNDTALVVDIGGGSTECVIGAGHEAVEMESLHMGCVTFSRHYFGDGRLSRSNFLAAEVAARGEVAKIAKAFRSGNWTRAVGSSGTARALADVLAANGLAESGITAAGLNGLRGQLLKARDIERLNLPGLKPDRVPVLAGGFSIMASVFAELGIDTMEIAPTALREGVLYDLLGRMHRQDTRDVTVRQFMLRYNVDRRQAMRVEELALAFHEQLAPELGVVEAEDSGHWLSWAARLHEVGLAIAHSGYHRHGAYIVSNADMPGFSKKEQAQLGLLLAGQRGSLAKLAPQVSSRRDWLLVLMLRLAVLLYRSRNDQDMAHARLEPAGEGFALLLDADWLEDNLFVSGLLEQEARAWAAAGLPLTVVPQARRAARVAGGRC